MDWNDILFCRRIFQSLENFVAWPHPYEGTVGEDRQPVGAGQHSRAMSNDHDRRALEFGSTDGPRQSLLAVAVRCS